MGGYLDGCRVLLGLAELERMPYPSDRKCAVVQHMPRDERGRWVGAGTYRSALLRSTG